MTRAIRTFQMFSDTLSGARDDRPGLATVKELTERGATLVSVTDGIDSSTAAGRMMIGVLGSLAEYERGLIKERTALKRAAARASNDFCEEQPAGSPGKSGSRRRPWEARRTKDLEQVRRLR